MAPACKQDPATGRGLEEGGGSDLIARVAELVETRTGIVVTRGQAGRRLAAALARHPLSGADLARWAALPDDAPEWQALLGTITVPETYLFRDVQQLELMVEAGLEPAIAASAGRTLRLWSAGCCTGEEAYSITVLALQALVKAGHGRETETTITLAGAWGVEVVGTDISTASLASAEAGIYATGELSAFRAMVTDRLRFFPAQGRTARRVRADVRQHVRFVRAGLVAGEAPGRAAFDVVACRNVLVYLTSEARRAAVETLSSAVRPGGLLLLGPADPAPDPRRFTAVWGRGALVHKRSEAAA